MANKKTAKKLAAKARATAATAKPRPVMFPMRRQKTPPHSASPIPRDMDEDGSPLSEAGDTDQG